MSKSKPTPAIKKLNVFNKNSITPGVVVANEHPTTQRRDHNLSPTTQPAIRPSRRRRLILKKATLAARRQFAVRRRFYPPSTPKLQEEEPRSFLVQDDTRLWNLQGVDGLPYYLFSQKRRQLPHVTSAYVPAFKLAASRLERLYRQRNRSDFTRRVLRAALRPVGLFVRRRTHYAHRFGRVFYKVEAQKRRRQLHKAQFKVGAMFLSQAVRVRRRQRPSSQYYQTARLCRKYGRARGYRKLRVIQRARRRPIRGRITLWTPRALWWSPHPRSRRSVVRTLVRAQKARVLPAVRSCAALQFQETPRVGCSLVGYGALRRSALQQSFVTRRVLLRRARGFTFPVRTSRRVRPPFQPARVRLASASSYKMVRRGLAFARYEYIRAARGVQAYPWLRARVLSVSAPAVYRTGKRIYVRPRQSVRRSLYVSCENSPRAAAGTQVLSGVRHKKQFSQRIKTTKIVWRWKLRTMQKYVRQEAYRRRLAARARKSLRYRVRRCHYIQRKKKKLNTRVRGGRRAMRRTYYTAGLAACVRRRLRRARPSWRRRYREGYIFAERRSRYLSRKRPECSVRKRQHRSSLRVSAFNSRLKQLARLCSFPLHQSAPARLPYLNFQVFVLSRHRRLGRAGRVAAFHRARQLRRTV